MSNAIALPNYAVNYGKTPLLLFVKTLPSAEQPFKLRQSDVTLELTLVARVDNRTEDNFGEVNLFDTGLQAIIPAGTYLEIVASPTLYKTGYMLAHGTHIIQPEDRNTIVVPLYKFKDGPDLELPFRAAQILPHASHYTQSNLTAVTKRNDDRNGYDVVQPQTEQRKGNAAHQNIGRPLRGGNKFF